MVVILLELIWKDQVLFVGGCAVAGMSNNIYLETGTWPARVLRDCIEGPECRADQLLWGVITDMYHQYIVADPGREPSSIQLP